MAGRRPTAEELADYKANAMVDNKTWLIETEIAGHPMTFHVVANNTDPEYAGTGRGGGGRLQLFFGEKPPEDVRMAVKESFRWAPNKGAWQCKLRTRSNSGAGMDTFRNAFEINLYDRDPITVALPEGEQAAPLSIGFSEDSTAKLDIATIARNYENISTNDVAAAAMKAMSRIDAEEISDYLDVAQEYHQRASEVRRSNENGDWRESFASPKEQFDSGENRGIVVAYSKAQEMIYQSLVTELDAIDTIKNAKVTSKDRRKLSERMAHAIVTSGMDHSMRLKYGSFDIDNIAPYDVTAEKQKTTPQVVGNEAVTEKAAASKGDDWLEVRVGDDILRIDTAQIAKDTVGINKKQLDTAITELFDDMNQGVGRFSDMEALAESFGKLRRYYYRADQKKIELADQWPDDPVKQRALLFDDASNHRLLIDTLDQNLPTFLKDRGMDSIVAVPIAQWITSSIDTHLYEQSEALTGSIPPDWVEENHSKYITCELGSNKEKAGGDPSLTSPSATTESYGFEDIEAAAPHQYGNAEVQYLKMREARRKSDSTADWEGPDANFDIASMYLLQVFQRETEGEIKDQKFKPSFAQALHAHFAEKHPEPIPDYTIHAGGSIVRVDTQALADRYDIPKADVEAIIDKALAQDDPKEHLARNDKNAQRYASLQADLIAKYGPEWRKGLRLGNDQDEQRSFRKAESEDATTHQHTYEHFSRTLHSISSDWPQYDLEHRSGEGDIGECGFISSVAFALSDASARHHIDAARGFEVVSTKSSKELFADDEPHNRVEHPVLREGLRHKRDQKPDKRTKKMYVAEEEGQGRLF